MGFTDAISYVLFTNPISATTVHYASSAASATIDAIGLQRKTEYIMPPATPLWKLSTMAGPYMKLAAISGATAVMLGAYGAHKKYANEDHRQIFETANRYHFYHSLALMGASFCRAPGWATMFFVSAMLMFCGTCYYSAFTGDPRFNKITPIGGVCFIIGWLTMCI